MEEMQYLEQSNKLDKLDNILSVDELRKITQTKQTEKRIEQDKRFHASYVAAFNTVIEDATEKMKSDALAGRYETHLYKWHYVEHTCEDFKFGLDNQKVRMLDIVRKGPLIEWLNNYFSKIDDKYYIAWKKILDDHNSYVIYISWRNKDKDKDKNKNKDSEIEKEYNSRPYIAPKKNKYIFNNIFTRNKDIN